ncbi:hypothetical protein CNMCM5878_000029 [Aspergillus fumigatiaffinis]|nr:hypothetical protein CNMCM5878_000029 [Aspergillus fumigatiaffinis]
MPVKLSLFYRASSLSPAHVGNVSSNITQAIQQVLAHPNECIKNIELVSPLNKSTILRWNRTEQKAKSLLEVIHRHAKDRPQHPAICAWDGTVSYLELEVLSSQWASYLQSQGVKPECLVPIMMDHSKWAIIGEIAILKAGGAFVPIDPAHPVSRLESIIQQTEAKIAISSAHLVDKLSSLVDTVIAISDETTSSLRKTLRDPVNPVGLDCTAYVLFTSGSTGRPKGCVVKYRALSDVVNQTTALKIGPESRVLQFASYTYGMSLIEIHCTLAVGATICVPSEDDRLNALDSAIRSMRVTWAILTPSTTLSIAESVRCLHTLVIAGEHMGIGHFRSLADKVELLQAFGLTEWSGICCVSQRIRSETDMRVIGRSPTANLWLVDPIDGNKLAPVGTVAELLVEGPALADGYLGDTHQTASAFIKGPPWLPVPTATGLYKTGDLVRYTADGNLQYIARKDNQVKIRGMRVELGEVEHQIRRASPLLEEAIVEAAATKNSNGIPVLVAFLYSASQTDSSGESFVHMIDVIKESLAQTLPDYMWPSVYVPLQSVPLTISRKIDRKALRHRIQTTTRKELEVHQSSSASIATPQTNLERQLHRFVAEVLHLELPSFGMRQSFISQGGDSVTAMLLVNKCKKHGYRVTVAAILQAQSLSDIASLLQSSIPTAEPASSHRKTPAVESQLKISSAPSGYAPIPRLSHSGPVEQSFSQARIWFLEELHPGSTWYLLPYATRLQGSLQLEVLGTALSALVERHETLRTTFESRNGTAVQIVAPFQDIQLQVIDIPSGSNAELMTALYQQQMTPFDLTKEAWRFTVFRLSPKDHVLSIVLHHIIFDGWSFDIFMKALGAYYSAAIRGLPPLSQVEPLPIQYRDFSVWQREEQSKVNQKQLAYWVSQLDGSQPAEFLCDKQRPAIPSGIAGCQDVKIGDSLYQDLQRFCRSKEVTPFTVLLAAFRATHYRLTGANDATIGIPSASRTRPELEELIGYFGNVQCIQTKIENRNQSFQQLVYQVQSVTTAAFENQEVPFDQVVSKLLTDRDVSRHPLVQVTFILHPQANFGQLHLEGLRTEHLRLPQVSRLDLEFHLYPGEDCLQGNILYAEDLFYPESIHAMLSVFYDVLRAGLCQPETDITSLPLRDGYPSLCELGLIYSENESHSQSLSIIDIFCQQVAAHQDRIAVIDTDTQLTYYELDQKSSMLATWLTNRHSFAMETPVGVFANRSCESIIAILGILKAGLAYVPLDIEAPIQRNETILSCLPSCQLVLVASGLTAPPISSQSTRFVYTADCCCETAEEVNGFPRATPSPVSSTSLAYILFTSGTTGKPKGVMVEHGGVIRLAKDPEIVSHSVECKVAPYILNPAFDASGFEVYSALLNGGTLVCIDKKVVWDYTALQTTFVKHGIRRVCFTTAMLKQCIASCPAIMGSLDILHVGGDKLDPKDIVKARRFGMPRIFNLYGPTENSIVSTSYNIPTEEAGINGIPIGRAIHNSGAYVMDPNLRLVPIGVMGELVVTGLGLARGYTDPEKNVGRFVTIHIGGKAVRAYRTGDMVRYRPSDAQLEFFGRMDQQVKIRGHRIELAEIDYTLLLNSWVNAAITVLQQTQDDQDPELVTFVTVQDAGAQFEKQIENEHVNAWRNITDGDDHYGNLGAIQRDTLGRDFRGWVSMYDGEAIDKEVMHDWLEDTIAAILQCGPTRVLEIGTGTGMILFNLIGGLQRYFGLEPSTRAVGFVREAVTHWVPEAARKVHIQCGTASDLAAVKDAGPIDLAIINSVVQYFPSLNYLVKVIKDLIHLQDVKCIFLGDIRSYALHPEFQISKVLHQYGHTLTESEFRQKMTEIAQLEKELLVDPVFFTSLASEWPDLIEHVEILPKQMKTTNELSCYRYTAILHVKRSSHPLFVREVEQSSWVDFKAQGLNRQSLSELLKTARDSSILAVSNIPYAKTIVERQMVDYYLGDSPMGTGSAGWSMDVCKQAQDCPALAAVDLIDLAQQTGWQVEISWARQRSQRGGLDAIFHRLEPRHKGARVIFRFPVDQHQRGLTGASSNDPLAPQRNQRIENQLLETLRAKLPSYMVPKMVRVLDHMPINTVGKVDRQALAQRADIALSGKAMKRKSLCRNNNVSFANSIERALWEEFISVLGMEVGITDSFFDCGGHSMMAIKLVSRINKRLRSSLRVSDLFQCPTISRLSELVRGCSGLRSSSAVTYEPFSLLDGSLSGLQSFDSSHYAEMQLPPDTEIVDILPVTECQAWFLTDWSPVSHTFTISGKLDVDQLRAACQTVMRHHAILRTVFTKLQGRLVQVVCGAVKAPFTHEYTGRVFNDTNDGVTFAPAGLSTRFALISRSAREHTFTLQLSHAQYDGLSLSSILSGIASAYGGSSQLPSTIPFSHYVHGCSLSRSGDALGFWKEYLKGSALSAIRSLTSAMNGPPVDIIREAAGDLLPLPEITFPTIVNAAIAITLAGLVRRNDVTFVCVMSSRDTLTLTQGTDTLLGPCVNRTLIRVKPIPESNALDFCRILRDNQARVSTQSHLGLDDIIENCTDWSSSDKLAPFVTHLPAGTATPSFSLSGTGVSYKSTDVHINPRNQVFVRSTTIDKQQACIQVQASSAVMDGNTASSLASRILTTAQVLSGSPERYLRSMGILQSPDEQK